MARTQRGSVRCVSTTGFHHASLAPAFCVHGSDLTIRSGSVWPNCFAKFQPCSFGHCLGGRHVLRVALRRAGVDPLGDRLDLLVGERAIVLEFLDADGLVDVPGRHLSRLHAVLDRPRPGPRLFERDERHRRDRIGPVAGFALVLEDRRDVFGECRRLCGCRSGHRNDTANNPRDVTIRLISSAPLRTDSESCPNRSSEI